jgi:methionyl-tRNA synthetase
MSIGTCPHCGYDRARGDQCENCTRVLDPIDLIEPRFGGVGRADIEIRDSTPSVPEAVAIGGRSIRAWIDATRPTGRARHLHRQQMAGRGPAGPRHHPRPGMGRAGAGRHRRRQASKGKVFYVWFDAPIEYIAATKEWADATGKGDWRDWWYGDAGAGRHAIGVHGQGQCALPHGELPVTILGTGEPWKLVDRIKGFNYLNYDGGKFSTSRSAACSWIRRWSCCPPITGAIT